PPPRALPSFPTRRSSDLRRSAVVRTLQINTPIPMPSPDEIRASRRSLGLRQAGSADFLVAGLGTVRYLEFGAARTFGPGPPATRSEEHTSELQSPCNLVC